MQITTYSSQYSQKLLSPIYRLNKSMNLKRKQTSNFYYAIITKFISSIIYFYQYFDMIWTFLSLDGDPDSCSPDNCSPDSCARTVARRTVARQDTCSLGHLLVGQLLAGHLLANHIWLLNDIKQQCPPSDCILKRDKFTIMYINFSVYLSQLVRFGACFGHTVCDTHALNLQCRGIVQTILPIEGLVGFRNSTLGRTMIKGDVDG